MPASAPAPAAIRIRRKRSASAGLKREQLQRQQHHRADHRGQMKPADREQMGKARAAHRLGILLGDAVLVAGGERGGDAALAAAAEPLADMRREPLAPAGDARARALWLGGRRDDGDIERAAAAADPLEPGGAGEIIAAGHGHRRRRHQPGAQPDGRARGEAAARSCPRRH